MSINLSICSLCHKDFFVPKLMAAAFCLILVALWILSVRPVFGQSNYNIALGCKYSLTPEPNYSLCLDSNDKTQLTDGHYTGGFQFLWKRKGTVGWQNAHPVVIIIDLESVQPIGGVSFNTAFGASDVHLPAIFILVSEDGKKYSYVGDLTELSFEYLTPKIDQYKINRFRTDQLNVYGRYVAIVVDGNGPFIFSDEIEIYRGDDKSFKNPPPDEEIYNFKQFFFDHQVLWSVKRRLRDDLAHVKASFKNLQDQKELDQEFTKIETEIAAIDKMPLNLLTTTIPLNDLHQRIFSLQAAVWRKRGAISVQVWQKNRWDMLSPTEPPQTGGARVDINLMKNEYRSAAFNISNAGPEAAKLILSISGLPGGINPEYINVREVLFTDTKSGVPVAAALPSAVKTRKGFRLVIPEGMTKQVWLTFHLPKKMPAGEYSGKISIEPGGIKVPVMMRIFPFVFPDQPTLHLGGWDYTDQNNIYAVTPGNRDSLIRHLREHYVDTPWATKSVMPYGKYDKQANMIQEPSSDNFYKWIGRWQNVRRYHVFTDVKPQFSGFKMGTFLFEKALTSWINWWVKTLKKWGVDPQQLGLLLVDEPNTLEEDKIIIEYATIIKKAQPKVAIWENVTWRNPWNATAKLYGSCDILSPNMGIWIRGGEKFADFYSKQLDVGQSLWLYSCSGPAKLLDPYSYYRMQFWFCWKYKAHGAGFWSFSDSNGASSWNEYHTRKGGYSPVFLDDEGITPGKHMEAIREGVEDYEYLRMLEKEIAKRKQQGVNGKDIESAIRLLATVADIVVSCCKDDRKKIYWKDVKDRSVADTVRIQVLEALLQLTRRKITGAPFPSEQAFTHLELTEKSIPEE